MDPFPTVEPIPILAPIWLFKLLLLLTLSMHFTAVHLLIGGLVLGTVWGIAGRRKGGADVLVPAARQVVRRLPVVMAYVINLGVPPLLFTQVLYGQALYTSSVLIGLLWISVIALLVVLYSLLYTAERRSAEGRVYWWITLIGLGLVAKIALIYVNNMTLMLRPDAWLEMYRLSPLGAHLASGDPTIWPRWTYMVVASLMAAGVAVALTGATAVKDRAVGAFLQQWGALTGALFAGLRLPVAAWVLSTQPAEVTAALGGSALYGAARTVWLTLILVVALVAGYASWRGRTGSWKLTALASLLVYLQVASWVLVRDGIRDLSLSRFGYSVWAREVNPNWSIVAAFLVVFAGGLVAVGWLIRTMLKAEGEHRGYAKGQEGESNNAA